MNLIMKKNVKLLITLVLINLIIFASLPITVLAEAIKEQTNTKSTVDKKNGEVIVMYKREIDKGGFSAKSSTMPSILNDFKIEKNIVFEGIEDNSIQSMSLNLNQASASTTDYIVSLIKSDKYSTSELIKKLKKEKSIMYVQENHIAKASAITNDSYEKYQWAIENIGQNGGTKGFDINPETSKNSTSNEKVIAIVDSGVDYNHPDLKIGFGIIHMQVKVIFLESMVMISKKMIQIQMIQQGTEHM